MKETIEMKEMKDLRVPADALTITYTVQCTQNKHQKTRGALSVTVT